MSINSRLTTPFNRETTADEALAGVDLTGRRAVITGASSGIGLETARSLAGAGAEVTLAVRNSDAGHKVAAAITSTRGNTKVEVAALELTDQSSVAAFISGWSGPLHILVNNAGIMGLPELRRTPEGWEYQFATNHLGHFHVALGLQSALAAEGARIVSVSSFTHLTAPIVFDDIHYEHRVYDPWSAYGQSKTANVLFAVEASRRWAEDGITANACHPGGVRSGLQRYLKEMLANNPEAKAASDAFPHRTAEQGAATSALLAASPLVEEVSGRYFVNCNEALPFDPATAGEDPEPAVVAVHALDPEAAERLWTLSRQMLNR
jgi:NAD(P)-dependent dehydrogenase (short-subunit alcohol dehydrogenase family)